MPEGRDPSLETSEMKKLHPKEVKLFVKSLNSNEVAESDFESWPKEWVHAHPLSTQLPTRKLLLPTTKWTDRTKLLSY